MNYTPVNHGRDLRTLTDRQAKALAKSEGRVTEDFRLRDENLVAQRKTFLAGVNCTVPGVFSDEDKRVCQALADECDRLLAKGIIMTRGIICGRTPY